MFGATLVLLLFAIVAALSTVSAGNPEYFLVRPDLRKCAFPKCGGYFLDPVNVKKFDCPRGEVSRRSECYVTEIRGIQVTAGLSLVRGMFVPYGLNRELNAFVATEGFEGNVHPHPQDNTDAFFAVNDLGIACFTTPCNTFQAVKLNDQAAVLTRMLVADVDLSKFPKTESEVRETMHVSDVIMAASSFRVEGPGGVGQGLLVSNYFTRTAKPPVPCRKSLECDKSEFCAREICTSVYGICKTRPFSCTKILAPVCACDGKREYDNDCTRQLFGASGSIEGKCPSA